MPSGGVRAAIDASIDMADALTDLTASKRFSRLAGQHAGLFEMRFTEAKIQYRPLFCEGPSPDAFTLLIGARKKNGNWTPLDARNTAVGRRGRIHEEGRVVEHGAEPSINS